MGDNRRIFRCESMRAASGRHLRLLDPGVAADAGPRQFKNNKVIGPILDAMPGANRCMRALMRRNRFSLHTSISRSCFNPNEVATICGSGADSFWDAAGKANRDYINDVLTRITLVGALTCDYFADSGMDDYRLKLNHCCW